MFHNCQLPYKYQTCVVLCYQSGSKIGPPENKVVVFAYQETLEVHKSAFVCKLSKNTLSSKDLSMLNGS